MSAIEVEGLRKTYAGGVEALRGVSFAVRVLAGFALVCGFLATRSFGRYRRAM